MIYDTMIIYISYINITIYYYCFINYSFIILQHPFQNNNHNYHHI